ncbi:MAG TPA: PIG-L family deacetylase, partial [bacterium]|nr:PIG-L family deacetylase [bacterium]
MRLRVSCIVPAYNEAATIGGVVRAARACPDVDEVIVVSDGSTDGTASHAERAGADRVIVLPRNGGKGDAVLAALQWTAGDVILLLDADLRGLEADHVSQLLRPVLDRRAEMAVALFADDQRHVLLRPLSGQRAIRRGLLTAEGLPGSGFGLEMALDRAARLRGERVTWVAWLGVHHRSKRQKYGTVNGLRLKVRASSDLLRQARPAGRRARSPSTQRRSPSMLLAMVVLVVLVAAAPPVFVVHPSHASTGGLPALPPPSAVDRFLVVVAHPDDEVIGAGGLIAAARRNGAAVALVVVTSGDSNRFSAAVLSRTLRPGAAQFMEEGRLRQEETREAMARLGVDARDVFYLGFPDRALDHVMRSRRPITSRFTHLDRALYPGVVAPGTPYAGPALTALLAQTVARVRPTIIVTHTPFDRHPDHRAVAELVERVRAGIPVYAFLVHAPGFPRPLRLAVRDSLAPPSKLARPDAWSWMRFDLSPELEQSKLRVVNTYRSQLASPYLRLLLHSFVRRNEIFAVHRTTDARPMPHAPRPA